MNPRYRIRRFFLPALGLLIPLSTWAVDTDLDAVSDDLELTLGLDPANATSFAGRPDWTGATGAGIPGYLFQQTFTNISGGTVKDLTGHLSFRTGTATRSLTSSASAPAASGTRMAGLFTAPIAGTYRFSLSADDTAQLWLGTDASAFTRSLAVSVNSWTAVNSFTDARSVSVTLA